MKSEKRNQKSVKRSYIRTGGKFPVSALVDEFVREVKKLDCQKLMAQRAKRELEFIDSHATNAVNKVKYLKAYCVGIAENMGFRDGFKKKCAALAKALRDDSLAKAAKAKTPMEAQNIISSVLGSDVYTEKNRQKTNRKKIEALKPIQKIWDIFNPSKELRSDARKEQSSSLIERSSEGQRVGISREAVKNAVQKGYFENIKKGDNTSRSPLACALILASGRRPIELFKLGKFEIVNTSEVRFTGMAKTRDRHAETLVIPILHMTAKQFTKGVQLLRKITGDLSGISNTEVDSMVSSPNNESMKVLLRNNDVVFYDGRKIYALMAYEAYKASLPEGVTPETDNNFYRRVLGHGLTDLGTANNYKTVELNNDSLKALNKSYKSKQKPVEAKTDKASTMARGATYLKTAKSSDTLAARLQKMTPEIQAISTRALFRCHQWAIGYAAEHSDAEFTQSLISREAKISRPAIKQWLELTKDVREG